MNRILEIDAALSGLFNNFGEIVRSLEPRQICLLSDENVILQQNYSGIYLIDVQVSKPQLDSADLSAWMRRFIDEWDHADFVGRNTPTTKKLRISQHGQLLEWMPIYIGKSSNIARRVDEHINLALDRRTVAMKLRSRPMWNERVFRLSTIHLPVKHYAVIAPLVEGELRAHVNPLVGRQ